MEGGRLASRQSRSAEVKSLLLAESFLLGSWVGAPHLGPVTHGSIPGARTLGPGGREEGPLPDSAVAVEVCAVGVFQELRGRVCELSRPQG